MIESWGLVNKNGEFLRKNIVLECDMFKNTYN